MWKPKNQSDEQKFVTTQCPVCKDTLGRRDREAIYMTHCDECRATFCWKPWEEKPSVTMDKDIKRLRRYCDRNGCHCRD